MAVFTSTMPSITGDGEHDIEQLRAWACRLVCELRAVLYSLDRENVVSAASVRAEDIIGVLNEEQLPELPASKLWGTADLLEVNAQNGVVFRCIDDEGNSEFAAEIYYEKSGSAPGLHINCNEDIYINGTKI